MKKLMMIMVVLACAGCATQSYERIAVSATNGAINTAAYRYSNQSVLEGAARGALQGVNCYPLYSLCNPYLYSR